MKTFRLFAFSLAVASVSTSVMAQSAAESAAAIWSKIRGHWVIPVGATSDMVCDITLVVTHQGYLQEMDLTDCDRWPELQKSAVIAIAKALPLPMPSDEEIYLDLRELEVTFAPNPYPTSPYQN